jgi:hypothetical protein
MPGDRVLRALLDSIPRLPKEQQLPELREIAQRCPHSVRLALKCFRGKTEYTCFMHAIGLLWSSKYIRIAAAANDFRFGRPTPFFASSAFIRHLLDSDTLSRIREECTRGRHRRLRARREADARRDDR